MKPAQLTKRYPVIASVVVILIAMVVTEAPMEPLRDAFSLLTGRFYGDYLTDLILNGLGAAGLILLAGWVGLGGRLGLRKPRPWAAVLLGWPIVLLALLSASEELLGEMELAFDPALLAIFLGLYFAIGLFEEVLFRGYVQGFMMRRWGDSRKGILVSVFVTNLLFGGAHLANLLMGRGEPLYVVSQVCFAFFFGLFFSALYVRCGSLWPGVALHMIYDFAVNLWAFAPGAPPRSEFVRTATPESVLAGLLITLPLFLLGIFYLRRSRLRVPLAAAA